MVESRLPGAGWYVVCESSALLRLLAEHQVALGFLHEPRRLRVIVRVGDVIAVTVRESEKRDVGGPVSDFSELASAGSGRSIAFAARSDSDAISSGVIWASGMMPTSQRSVPLGCATR